MNAANSLRVRVTRWPLLALACLLPLLAWAQTPAGSDGAVSATTKTLPTAASDETAPAATDRTAPAARNGAKRPPSEPRFNIELKAPEDLRAFLNEAPAAAAPRGQT